MLEEIKDWFQWQKINIEILQITVYLNWKYGLKKECPLSSYLLNIYTEEDRLMLRKETEEIKINEKSIHYIRFAEDINEFCRKYELESTNPNKYSSSL